MSYDLHIYGARSVSTEGLLAIAAKAGLQASDDDIAGGSLAVRRRGAYSFTVGLPLRVEAEDVPDEVTAVALDVNYLYEIHVEATAPDEIAHATRFARRLAEATTGVVLDQQTDQVWTRGKIRQPPKVDQGVVSVVEVHWYVAAGAAPGAAAEAWLDVCRRHLPEALPRRYGAFEPLQHRLDEGGDEAFTAFVADETDTVFIAPSRPAVDGSLAPGITKPGRMYAHGLTLLAEPLADERWRAALRRMFIGFAERIDAVAAVAEVVRGVHWSGRSLGYGQEAERIAYLSRLGRWWGLPYYPVWWAWFGSLYAPLVRDHLPADHVEDRGVSLFHWGAEAPANRDELLAAAPALPPELLAGPTRDRYDLKRAAVIPAALRSDPTS